MTTEIKTDVDIEQLIHPNLREASMSKIPLFAEMANKLNKLAHDYADYLDPESRLFIHFISSLYKLSH